MGPWGSCQLTVLTCPLSLQQILAPLMSSYGYTHRFCREDDKKATSNRKGLLTKWSNRGPPEAGFEPRCGRGGFVS
jgi:hypothetical protein